MNLSGIRPSTGFYEHNSIRFRPELSSLAAEETSAQDLADEGSTASATVSEEEITKIRAGQTFGSYDFASQYKPGTVHELKGADSDINKLDIEKAVNDMQKDSAIHRYQYFVQSKNNANPTSTSQSGTENFTL